MSRKQGPRNEIKEELLRTKPSVSIAYRLLNIQSVRKTEGQNPNIYETNI